MKVKIETEIRKDSFSNTDIFIVKSFLDHSFYRAIQSGELAGLADKIADKLADQILPEMEQQILQDPVFKKRILNDILVRIANRIADKGLIEKEEKSKQ